MQRQGATRRGHGTGWSPVSPQERAFFVHGFAKSDLGSIRVDELAAFWMLASHLLAYDDAALAAAVEAGALMEIMSDG